MDAITLLKKDHATVKALFAKYDKLGDDALKEKQALVQKITHELCVHAAVEEEILYPAARNQVKAKEDLVLESLEEHHVVKVVLSELQTMKPSHERFDAKVTVLKEAVEHHVEEEEGDLFPALRKKLGAEKLAAIGKALESAKKLAPTRPHPDAPDEPPGNLLAGLPTALLDKVRDLVASGPSMRTAPASRKKQAMTASASMNRMSRAPQKKQQKKSGK